MINNSEEMINESPAKNQGLAARKRRFSSEKTANCRTPHSIILFVYQHFKHYTHDQAHKLT